MSDKSQHFKVKEGAWENEPSAVVLRLIAVVLGSSVQGNQLLLPEVQIALSPSLGECIP